MKLCLSQTIGSCGCQTGMRSCIGEHDRRRLVNRRSRRRRADLSVMLARKSQSEERHDRRDEAHPSNPGKAVTASKPPETAATTGAATCNSSVRRSRKLLLEILQERAHCVSPSRARIA